MSFAAFDPEDVLQIQATGSYSHDNNLFRLPEGDTERFGIAPQNKADNTRVIGVGLKLNKPISRQRLTADLNLNDVKFTHNTNLDHIARDGRLAWLWQVGNYWSGTAAYANKRQLAGFGDFRQSVKDLVENESYTLSGNYQLHPRWSIGADVGQTEVKHTAIGRIALDSDSKTWAVTGRYHTPSENSVGVQARRTERNFPNRSNVGFVILDNNHVEDRINLLGYWRYSGLLSLDAQLGHVDVSHEELSNRDFSGVTWRAGLIWDPTSKLRVTVKTSKDVRLYEDLVSNYVVAKQFVVSPIYAITPKISLQGDFTHENRDYLGDPGFVVGRQSREDKVRSARLALTYSPFRYIDLSVSYEKGQRRSNADINNYDYETWFGTVRISF